MKREFTFRGFLSLLLTAWLVNFVSVQALGQNTNIIVAESKWDLAGENTRVSLRPNGTIETLEVKAGGQWQVVKFRNDVLSGPAWGGVTLSRIAGENASFAGRTNGVRHTLRYQLAGNRLAVIAALQSEGTNVYAPKAGRLVLGIDCEMKSFPSWNDRYFPTLLRCERTHFWGYFMTPKGQILTVGSPDPVAAYNINYDDSVWGAGDGGHLIRSASLDLLHALPLPARYPQNLVSLPPGEERSWTIYFEPVNSLEQVKPVLSKSLAAPMIEADRYTLAEGESSSLIFFSSTPVTAFAIAPDGKIIPLVVKSKNETELQAIFTPASGFGLYTIKVTSQGGHQSEASITVRHPWSWYMIQAREESLHHAQYASSHLEQWLGLETGALARRYFPDAALDARTDLRLKEILAAQWDLDKMVPTNIPHAYRNFPNTVQMAGLLADRYLADGDTNWLRLASGFADYAVCKQRDDGNYVDYTAVFYPAKSVLTVAAAEQSALAKDTNWQSAYARHYASAKRAVDFLVRSQDNLNTEGQKTFEDGMISCSGTQMGLFALLQTNAIARQHYAEAARKMLLSHRCLEQLLIPDSRMNGATLRFWEAQYDTLLRGSMNMMDSPHGWSAWLIPGLWYQYLLTGDEVWLQKTMNALGSCAQLVDNQSGELRWAFVPDPYREVTMLEPNPQNPKRGLRVKKIIGEEYVPMIAAFHSPDYEPISGNSPDSGWTSCNDVHEVFIAMEEVALTSAYVIERADGELAAWNCRARRDNSGIIHVEPAEKIVSRVHFNLRQPHSVEVRFATAPVKQLASAGMQWIGPGGVPELLR